MTTRGHSEDAESPSADTLGHRLRDLADRLRRLPESRLNKVATGARDLAQALADAAAGIEGRGAPAPPPERLVPLLNVFAVADQVAVTAHDLTAAAAGVDPATPIWWLGERQALTDVLEALAGQVERVRSET